MKILMVTQAPLTLQSNGVIISTLTFARGLAAAGHDVTIAAPGAAPKLAGKHNTFNVLHLKTYPGFVGDFPGVPKSAWWPHLNFFKTVDIVHIQHPFSAGWNAIDVAKKLGKPVVGTYHTLYVEYAKTFARLPGLREIAAAEELHRTKKYFALTDHMILPSGPMRKVIEKYGISTKNTTVIPTGVNLESYKRQADPALLKSLKLPIDRPIVLFVGRISHEKNVEAVLQVADKLRGHPSKPLFVLTGTGQGAKLYQGLAAKMRLGPDILRFTGRVAKEQTEKLFGQAKVFLFLSLTDTQGIVVVEAMSAGTVPVVADALGPSTLLADGQSGFVVAAKSQTQIVNDAAKRVAELLENDALWKKLSHGGLLHAKLFSVEATTRQLVSVYRQVIAEKRKGDVSQPGSSANRSVRGVETIGELAKFG